jgi:hypothetical protein
LVVGVVVIVISSPEDVVLPEIIEGGKAELWLNTGEIWEAGELT